jgi:hypothetical protein
VCVIACDCVCECKSIRGEKCELLVCQTILEFGVQILQPPNARVEASRYRRIQKCRMLRLATLFAVPTV